METKEAIFGRRSVRKYTDQPVSDEDLMEVINAGLVAPSGINLQPWYFVVVKSEEKLRELAQITGQVFGKFKPVLDKRFEKNPEAIDETEEFLNTMGGAKICILVFLLKDDYEDYTTVVEGTSAAIQNMCLMAYDKGLATCWLTAALRGGVGEEIRKKFAPDKGPYLAMLTLGYPAVSPKMPPRREGRYVII
ncbi:MAG: nitroreductase [Epulopiscium sp.]|nr:nitroreductase [Candidatus Epulonipiscium sp.]